MPDRSRLDRSMPVKSAPEARKIARLFLDVGTWQSTELSKAALVSAESASPALTASCL
jgi:hypothetical protein